MLSTGQAAFRAFRSTCGVSARTADVDPSFVAAISISSSVFCEYIDRNAKFDPGQLAWSTWLSWAIIAFTSIVSGRYGSGYSSISQDVEAQSIPLDREEQVQTGKDTQASWVHGVTLLAVLIAFSQSISNSTISASSWALVGLPSFNIQQRKLICCVLSSPCYRSLPTLQDKIYTPTGVTANRLICHDNTVGISMLFDTSRMSSDNGRISLRSLASAFCHQSIQACTDKTSQSLKHYGILGFSYRKR